MPDLKIKVVIEKSVTVQIAYLCRRYHNVEWSGILFYTVQGTIKNPEKMVIRVNYIYPMDIGSSSFTSYEFDENLIMFLMENPALRKARMGHVHSHNNMSVFFSATDTDELIENAVNHNYYLSIIVNNHGDIIGKIGQVVEASTASAKDENGKLYKLQKTTLPKLVTITNCEITGFNSLPVSAKYEDIVKNLEKRISDKKRSQEIKQQVQQSSFPQPKFSEQGQWWKEPKVLKDPEFDFREGLHQEKGVFASPDEEELVGNVFTEVLAVLFDNDTLKQLTLDEAVEIIESSYDRKTIKNRIEDVETIFIGVLQKDYGLVEDEDSTEYYSMLDEYIRFLSEDYSDYYTTTLMRNKLSISYFGE